MQEETKRVVRKQQTPYRFYLLGLVGLVVIAGVGYFAWTKWMVTTPEQEQAKALAQAEEEKKEVMDALSKLMVLPSEDPVMFKVSNQEQMRAQQAFFKDANNDDVLLVYQQASKAVLYRPSNNTIVNVGPINFDNTQTQNNQKAPAPTPTIKTTDTKTETNKK